MDRVLDNGNVWQYFNKGNANILYQYTGSDPHLNGKILRLRLSSQEFTSKDVFQFISKEVRPLIKEVIPTELVKVQFRKIGALNEGYGLLIPNMIPEGARIIKSEKYFTVYQKKDITVIEIKPKWLVLTDYGCRNCANHRYKHKEEPVFCSRLLLDDNKRTAALKQISEDKKIQSAVIEYLKSEDSIFTRLQRLQGQNVKLESLRDISGITPEVRLQMTLRDVTVFITIQCDSVSSVIVTDADPKSASKWKRWQATQQKLISEKFYNL